MELLNTYNFPINTAQNGQPLIKSPIRDGKLDLGPRQLDKVLICQGKGKSPYRLSNVPTYPGNRAIYGSQLRTEKDNLQNLKDIHNPEKMLYRVALDPPFRKKRGKK